MSKLKIFVSAYACEPGLGSEIGVGWHWVLEFFYFFYESVGWIYKR